MTIDIDLFRALIRASADLPASIPTFRSAAASGHRRPFARFRFLVAADVPSAAGRLSAGKYHAPRHAPRADFGARDPPMWRSAGADTRNGQVILS
jgi:hypothetical protein